SCSSDRRDSDVDRMRPGRFVRRRTLTIGDGGRRQVLPLGGQRLFFDWIRRAVDYAGHRISVPAPNSAYRAASLLYADAGPSFLVVRSGRAALFVAYPVRFP